MQIERGRNTKALRLITQLASQPMNWHNTATDANPSSENAERRDFDRRTTYFSRDSNLLRHSNSREVSIFSPDSFPYLFISKMSGFLSLRVDPYSYVDKILKREAKGER